MHDYMITWDLLASFTTLGKSGVRGQTKSGLRAASASFPLFVCLVEWSHSLLIGGYCGSLRECKWMLVDPGYEYEVAIRRNGLFGHKKEKPKEM